MVEFGRENNQTDLAMPVTELVSNANAGRDDSATEKIIHELMITSGRCKWLPASTPQSQYVQRD